MEVNLVLVKKDGSQRPITIPVDSVLIGRERGCDLQVPLATVSRRHCRLTMSGGKLSIRDLGSKNGTVVNGKKVEASTLQAGDRLVVGEACFVCQIDGMPEHISVGDSGGENSVEKKAESHDQETELSEPGDLGDGLDVDFDELEKELDGN
jgi:predicted component of type VI protein secretion system